MENYYNTSNTDLKQRAPSERSTSTMANTGNTYGMDGLNNMNGMNGINGMNRMNGMNGVNGMNEYHLANKHKIDMIDNTFHVNHSAFVKSPHFDKNEETIFQTHPSLNSIGTNPYMNQNQMNPYGNSADLSGQSNQNFQKEFFPSGSTLLAHDNICQNMEAMNSTNRYNGSSNQMRMTQGNVGSLNNMRNVGNIENNNMSNKVNAININEITTQHTPGMHHTINNYNMDNPSFSNLSMSNQNVNSLNMSSHNMSSHNINSHNINGHNMNNHNIGNYYMKAEYDNGSLIGSNHSRNLSRNMNNICTKRPSNSCIYNPVIPNSQQDIPYTKNNEFLNNMGKTHEQFRYQQNIDQCETNHSQMMPQMDTIEKKKKHKDERVSILRTAVYEAVMKSQLKNQEIPISSKNENEIIVEEQNPFQVAICLEKLDELNISCNNQSKVRYSINAYFNAYDDIINKYQSKCYKCFPNSTQTHVSCDLSHEIIVLPYNNEPFLYLKVSEISEYKTETIGRLQLKVKELPQELPLKIAIKGDDGSQKGYLLMYFFLTNYTIDENTVPQKYKKKNINRPQGTAIRRKGTGFHFFENFTRWCCDISYDPMN